MATKFWNEHVVVCNGNYFWASTERGGDPYFAQIFYESKSKPDIIIENSQTFTPKSLSEAEKLNGVDPLPTEWRGTVKAVFTTIRYSRLNANGWLPWETSIEANQELSKEHDKWSWSERFPIIINSNCSFVSEYFIKNKLTP